jgi:hypothetical protein
MFFTLKSSILVISGYLRTVQVAPGHPVMPCESLGKSLQTCLSQDKSGFPDGSVLRFTALGYLWCGRTNIQQEETETSRLP